MKYLRLSILIFFFCFATKAYAAFPNTPILDNFDRTNEGPPPSASWSGPIWSGDPQLRVISNALANDTSPGGDNYWNVTQFSADQEVYGTVTVLPGTDSNMGLYARVQTPNNAAMKAYELDLLVVAAANNDALELYRDSVGTTLATFNLGFDAAAGDSWGMTVIGSVITAYYKQAAGAWTIIGTFDDAGANLISGSGYVGVGFGFGSGAGARFDNFGGGAVFHIRSRLSLFTRLKILAGRLMIR